VANLKKILLHPIIEIFLKPKAHRSLVSSMSLLCERAEIGQSKPENPAETKKNIPLIIANRISDIYYGSSKDPAEHPAELERFSQEVKDSLKDSVTKRQANNLGSLFAMATHFDEIKGHLQVFKAATSDYVNPRKESNDTLGDYYQLLKRLRRPDSSEDELANANQIQELAVKYKRDFLDDYLPTVIKMYKHGKTSDREFGEALGKASELLKTTPGGGKYFSEAYVKVKEDTSKPRFDESGKARNRTTPLNFEDIMNRAYRDAKSLDTEQRSKTHFSGSASKIPFEERMGINNPLRKPPAEKPIKSEDNAVDAFARRKQQQPKLQPGGLWSRVWGKSKKKP